MPHPNGGARLQAFTLPAAEGSGLVVRKRPSYTPILDEHVTRGRTPAPYRDVLGRAVEDRQTVVVCGGTGSGKTTLGRALLGEVARRCPGDRLVILDDTPELACPLENPGKAVGTPRGTDGTVKGHPVSARS